MLSGEFQLHLAIPRWGTRHEKRKRAPRTCASARNGTLPHSPEWGRREPILTMWFIHTMGWGKGSEVPAGIWRNLKNVSPGEGAIRTSARVVWFRSHEKPGAGESAEPESGFVAVRARGRRVMGRGC